MTEFRRPRGHTSGVDLSEPQVGTQRTQVVLGRRVVTVGGDSALVGLECLAAATGRLVGNPEVIVNRGSVGNQPRGPLEVRDRQVGLTRVERVAPPGVVTRTGVGCASPQERRGKRQREKRGGKMPHARSVPGRPSRRKVSCEAPEEIDMQHRETGKHRGRDAATALAWIMVALACGAAAADSAAPSIHVTGEGRAQAVPDMATLSSGVTSEAAQAQAAVRANSQAMNGVLAALRTQGIAEKDIQTQQLQLMPVYANEGGGRRNRITGYRASSRLSVRVLELDRAGAILDALVSAGATDLGNISFGVQNPEPLLDQARTAAVADARRKAALLAREAGAGLGRLLEVRDGATPQPFRAGRGARLEAGFAAQSVPIARGELEFSARVSVVYALEPRS